MDLEVDDSGSEARTVTITVYRSMSSFHNSERDLSIFSCLTTVHSVCKLFSSATLAVISINFVSRTFKVRICLLRCERRHSSVDLFFDLSSTGWLELIPWCASCYFNWVIYFLTLLILWKRASFSSSSKQWWPNTFSKVLSDSNLVWITFVKWQLYVQLTNESVEVDMFDVLSDQLRVEVVGKSSSWLEG